MSAKPARTAQFPMSLARVAASGAVASAQGRDATLRPQRMVQEAHIDARSAAAPVGLGLDSAAVRLRMVARIRQGGVQDEAVLAAMARVQRHLFVDSALATQAYEDTSLPIGWEQTISKPSVVARMLSLLCAAPSRQASGAGAAPLGRVLEIGTGCGYQAALLALLARRVVSIERLGPLNERARAHLQAQGFDHVRLLHADGRLGCAQAAPFDAIIAAAGGDEIPSAWLDQLAMGGRLVAPMVQAQAGGQVLVVIDKRTTGLHQTLHDAVHFVPLKSGLVQALR